MSSQILPFKIRGLLLLTLVSLFAVIGCSGDPGVEVTGMVRLDGEPLNGGKVTFFHPKYPGRNVTAYIQPDGSYRVLWTPRGEVRAAVVALPPRRQDRDPKTARGPQKVANVPVRYADPDTSNLVFQIRAGNQEIDIDLNS